MPIKNICKVLKEKKPKKEQIKNILKLLKEKKLIEEQIRNIDRKLKWEVSKFPIFIDNRGTGERDLAKLLEDMHLAVQIIHVDSGDVVIGEIGIERKTVNDLINSVTGENRHFFEQLKVLKATYKKPLLIVEGPFTYKDKWISGVLYSVFLGWGIQYITTFNIQDTAEVIKGLFIKYGNARSKAYPPAAVRKAMTPEKIRWAMLMCIKGIGPVTATNILKVVNPFILTKSFTLGKVKGLNKRSKELLIQVFKG